MTQATKKTNGNKRNGQISIPQQFYDALENDSFHNFENHLLSNKLQSPQAAHLLKQVCEKPGAMPDEYKKAELLLECLDKYAGL